MPLLQASPKDSEAPHPDLTVRLEAIYHHISLSLILPKIPKELLLIRTTYPNLASSRGTKEVLLLPTPTSVLGSREEGLAGWVKAGEGGSHEDGLYGFASPSLPTPVEALRRQRRGSERELEEYSPSTLKVVRRLVTSNLHILRSHHTTSLLGSWYGQGIFFMNFSS